MQLSLSWITQTRTSHWSKGHLPLKYIRQERLILQNSNSRQVSNHTDGPRCCGLGWESEVTRSYQSPEERLSLSYCRVLTCHHFQFLTLSSQFLYCLSFLAIILICHLSDLLCKLLYDQLHLRHHDQIPTVLWWIKVVKIKEKWCRNSQIVLQSRLN